MMSICLFILLQYSKLNIHLTFYFSNTELNMESVVTRHRRQFKNCQCCHCQNHNNYIQNYTRNDEKCSLPSPCEDPDPEKESNKSYTENVSSAASTTLFSSKSFNFNINGNDWSGDHSMLCTDGIDKKKNYHCLNQKYIGYLESLSSTKRNKTFLLAKNESFLHSIS